MKVCTDKEFTLASTDNTSATPVKQAKLEFTSPLQKVSEGHLKNIIAKKIAGRDATAA